MNLKKIGIYTAPNAASKYAGEYNQGLDSIRNLIPDEVYSLQYRMDDKVWTIDLKKLLEVDVSELTEMTMNKLRTQMEQIASIRMTLERAYEQMMEDYSLYKIDYDVWWADMKTIGKDLHWQEQLQLKKTHELANSALKAPTEDDVLSALLRVPGHTAEYRVKKDKEIKFQRMKSLYEKVDQILNSREFTLKVIIESRDARNG